MGDENDLLREVAQLADEVAFWKYHAKWYYCAYHGLPGYDNVSAGQDRAIEEVFAQARANENRARLTLVDGDAK